MTIAKGDIISTSEYLKIEKIGTGPDNKPAAMVQNLETGESFGISVELAEGYLHSTNYTEEEKVSMTEAASILESVGDKVFTVTFNKKPNPVEVAAKIEALSDKDKRSKTKVERCMLGEERTMRARLVSVEPKLGRSQVIDLDIDKQIKGDWDSRQRQVDHRTIKSLIVNNVKYTVK